MTDLIKLESEQIEKIKNIRYNTLSDLNQGIIFEVLKTQKRAIHNQEYTGKITIYD